MTARLHCNPTRGHGRLAGWWNNLGMSRDPIRIGCLGAARIAPAALIKPARNVEGVVVSAVAARDQTRAAVFAKKHGIPRVYESYQELVDAADVDAVYIP